MDQPETGKMKKFFKKVIYINRVNINLLFVLSLIFISCGGQKGQNENSTGAVIPAVEAVQTRFGSLPLTQRLSGTVEAKNQIVVYPEINAVITDVFVKNGDFVKKGQPLVKLRDKEFTERLKQANAGYQIAQAQLKQAEARLNELQAELKRTETLAAQELASETELETARTLAVSAEADVALAQARLEQAQATAEERKETLSQTLVRAAISGTVGNRNAEVGMLVNGSTRLFSLGQLDNVRVEVILTDKMLSYLREGQRVEINNQNIAAGVLNASLSRISPFLNPVSHSTEAEIDLENTNGSLIPGMFVTVDVFYGESEQATLVPLSALYENPTTGETGVYVTEASFNEEAIVTKQSDKSIGLSEPVDFKFVPVEVIAKGRMEAGINGIEKDKWIITLGQNLLGGDEGKARVRPVNWTWVEKLQVLKREDLMEGLVNGNQKTTN